jgi:hypothetical protein
MDDLNRLGVGSDIIAPQARPEDGSTTDSTGSG